MSPTDLEAQDDSPDEAQGEAVVSIHDVVGAHVFQVNPLLFEKLQGFVHVLQAVDPHAASRGSWLWENEILMNSLNRLILSVRQALGERHSIQKLSKLCNLTDLQTFEELCTEA